MRVGIDSRPPRDHVHAVGGQRPDRYRSSPRAPGARVTVAHDALVAVHQMGVLAEKVCNFGLYRLGKQGTRPIAQDFGEVNATFPGFG